MVRFVIGPRKDQSPFRQHFSTDSGPGKTTAANRDELLGSGGYNTTLASAYTTINREYKTPNAHALYIHCGRDL